MTLLAQTTAPAPPAGTTWPEIGIAVAVILVVVLLLALWARRRRSAQLKRRFGPEYDRTVTETGSRQRAEADLAARERRHRKLDIRPLAPGARDRYVEEWRGVQARFVDQPALAVGEADHLIANVMRDRGYPVENVDQQLDDLSVEHGAVIDKYRSARAIALRSERKEATTEELRRAMLDYRALFDDLVGEPVGTTRK